MRVSLRMRRCSRYIKSPLIHWTMKLHAVKQITHTECKILTRQTVPHTVWNAMFSQCKQETQREKGRDANILYAPKLIVYTRHKKEKRKILWRRLDLLMEYWKDDSSVTISQATGGDQWINDLYFSCNREQVLTHHTSHHTKWSVKQDKCLRYSESGQYERLLKEQTMYLIVASVKWDESVEWRVNSS